jgi:hypothetical protein
MGFNRLESDAWPAELVDNIVTLSVALVLGITVIIAQGEGVVSAEVLV